MTHLKILAHEIRMNIFELKAYKFSFLIDIAIFFAIYSFLIISDSGYKLSVYYSNEVTTKELILLGYAMWIISISAINTVCGEIRQENIKGTLEQKFMAVVSFQVVSWQNNKFIIDTSYRSCNSFTLILNII